MPWTKLPFGKYEGKTLPRVVFQDPDWFFWAFENGIFTTKNLKREAENIAYKAKRIRIPESLQYDIVEYYIDPTTGKLGDVRPIEENKPIHQGSSKTFRKNFFDLSAARNVSQYDKHGGKIVVKNIKYYVFGNKNTKLTQKKCEKFFEDPKNFA